MLKLSLRYSDLYYISTHAQLLLGKWDTNSLSGAWCFMDTCSSFISIKYTSMLMRVINLHTLH